MTFRLGKRGRQRNKERRRERKAKAKRGGTRFQGGKINSLILVASLLMVSELGLSTFVLFGVVSVGVVKNDWLLVIQLDEKIGYILDLVDVASDIIVSEPPVSGVVNAMTFVYWVMKI
jgi:hypothetical protein